MIEIRRILCPVDFSDFSRRALDHAIAIARWYDASVTALYVFSPAPVPTFGHGPVVLEPIILTSPDRDQLLADVGRFIAEQQPSGVVVDAVLREGNAAPGIVGQATSMGADLLVIGTHGRSGFERVVLGSVTERVLRKAPCPVLTVPRQLANAGGVVYKRLLCPVDFSETSVRALEYALSLAREADGLLTVLHVQAHEDEYPLDMALAGYDAATTLGEFRRSREASIRRRLDELAPAAGEYCTVERLVTHGKPWREVLRQADERQSDVIVMGVQGRGPADLFLFGSTTQHVVRGASCPVLTIRSL
jgi:nucleotide-binding universal stress UspA family protein